MEKTFQNSATFKNSPEKKVYHIVYWYCRPSIMYSVLTNFETQKFLIIVSFNRDK